MRRRQRRTRACAVEVFAGSCVPQCEQCRERPRRGSKSTRLILPVVICLSQRLSHAWGNIGAIGATLGPHWGKIGATLGGNIGATWGTLGQHWGNVGGNIGATLGQHWGHIGATLGQPTLGPHWGNVRPTKQNSKPSWCQQKVWRISSGILR